MKRLNGLAIFSIICLFYFCCSLCMGLMMRALALTFTTTFDLGVLKDETVINN